MVLKLAPITNSLTIWLVDMGSTGRPLLNSRRLLGIDEGSWPIKDCRDSIHQENCYSMGNNWHSFDYCAFKSAIA
jgi:hypothetical protein